MERATNKTATQERHLGIGSSLAAGAIMLCHMNSSGLSRYDNLMADLSRLNTTPRMPRRADRPQRPRSRWVSWFTR